MILLAMLSRHVSRCGCRDCTVPERRDANARSLARSTSSTTPSRNDGRIVRPIRCKCRPRCPSHDHVAVLVGCVQLRRVTLYLRPRPEKTPPVACHLDKSVSTVSTHGKMGTYCCRCEVSARKRLVAVLCNLLGLVVVLPEVVHCRFEVRKVLGCFNVIDIRASKTHKMCVEFLPLERVCDER